MDSEQVWVVALGLVVRQLRKDAGLTQEQFAQRLQLTRNQIQKLEYGETSLRFRNLLRVCAVLRLTPPSLLSKALDLVESPDGLQAARASQESERHSGRPRTAVRRGAPS